LKNTYLKTLKHTNETINYGMIQMSGGDMEMNFDQESIYFKGHCIEYDTVDMFQMMVDIALEPRSVLAANVAQSKNGKSHALAAHMNKFDPSSKDLSSSSELLTDITPLVCPFLELKAMLETLMPACFNNSSWTTSPLRSALLLPLVLRTTTNTLSSLRNVLVKSFPSQSMNTFANPLNILVVNTEPGLNPPRPLFKLPFNLCLGAMLVSLLFS